MAHPVLRSISEKMGNRDFTPRRIARRSFLIAYLFSAESGRQSAQLSRTGRVIILRRVASNLADRPVALFGRRRERPRNTSRGGLAFGVGCTAGLLEGKYTCLHNGCFSEQKDHPCSFEDEAAQAAIL
jgi:hypothetical protein